MFTSTMPPQQTPSQPVGPERSGPLSEEDLLALSDARLRMKRVRRSVAVANVSGWTLAIFAALTLLGVFFGDLTALILALALGACAANELRGAAMLRRLDTRAPKTLGWNQIALAVVIVAYASWSLYRATQQPSPLAAAGGTTGDPQLDEMVTSLTTTVTYAFYGVLAAVGIIAPGLTSLYYFSRARHLRRVLDQTPPWVIGALRAAN